MRTWGRVTNPDGSRTWVEVSTDAKGYNDQVYLTTLVQVLQLNLGESPFFGDWGIPAAASVLQQVQPDYYVSLTQQRFAQYFASILLAKRPQPPNQPTPVYALRVVTQQGAILTGPIAT